MSYYETIAEDLARAKAILAKGRDVPELPDCLCDGGEQGEGLVSIPHEPHCPLAHASPEPVHVGTIYGGDVYAAYKLLESFVAEIERLQAIIEPTMLQHMREMREAENRAARLLTAYEEQQDRAVAVGTELQQFLGLFSDYEDPCESFAQAEAIWNDLKAREGKLHNEIYVLRAALKEAR